MDKFDSVIAPALKQKRPHMTEEDVEVFRRMWEVSWFFRLLEVTKLTCVQYYFAYSEAGFLTKTLGDVIITVGREGALEMMEGIPL